MFLPSILLLQLLLSCPSTQGFHTAFTSSTSASTSTSTSTSTRTTSTTTFTKLQSTKDEIQSPNKTKRKVQKPKSKKWFPVKPEDALLTNYDTLVRGAYVRHVVLETEDMADLAIKTYLRGGVDNEDGSSSSTRSDDDDTDKTDPFGKLAKDLSACTKSRDENGKIGWIDNPFHPSKANTNTGTLINEVVSELIPYNVIEELFLSRPKGGDVLKLKSEKRTDDDNNNSKQWHLCRIDDLLIDYVSKSDKDGDLNSDSDLDESIPVMNFKQRGVNKIFTSRSKLKGLGTTPKTPQIIPNVDNLVTSSTTGNKKIAKKYHVATSGCQMNVADSERLAGVLENKLNLEKATKPNDADVVILNTCSIRDHAEQKVYDTLGPYAARKRKGESIALIVAGCVAQQEGEALLKRVPEVDLVMGPQYVNRLDDLLDDVSRGHQVVATDPTLLSEDLSRPVRGHSMRAWVNVIHGCNEHCTYCVVPGVRGVEQSRSMESILQECMDLAEAGYKEITLLGQNIDAYGRDMTPKRNFADLLHYLNDAIPDNSIERIRYVTSHPRYFSDRVIDAVLSLDKVCELFHLPFQAGDDAVLRGMRRGYTFDSYMKIIHKIRERSLDAAICGDVIVGFPGETDEAFQRTLDLMNEVKFDNLNTFAYSKRPNTEAALWEDQVPEDVKAERLQQVQRLATQHGLERSERYLGKVVEVLVEDINPRNSVQVLGRTRQNRQVFFDANIDECKGKLVDVLITEARPWSLTGELA
jgi:tRNA-2-methylthio-N6-dimethylallyladenosine synthase